ncbi:MAG: transporter permease [Bacilli bacterium]|nr:transporter permease [Bacilli bacterium]
MFKQIRNENLKIYRRSRTWVMFGILLIAVLLQATFMFSMKTKVINNDWKQQLIQQNDYIQSQLAAPQLTRESKQLLQVEFIQNKYFIEHNQPPTDYSVWKFIGDASNQIILATIFTVILAGDMLATEFTWGTIKLLLIRPISRGKIMLAKFLAVCWFGLMSILLIFISSLLIGGGLFFGVNGGSEPYFYAVPSGNVVMMSYAGYACAAFLLKAPVLLMISTIAFMLSALTRSSSLAISLSLFFLFFGEYLTTLLGKYQWEKYVLFVNMDMTHYLNGNPLVPGMSIRFSIALMAVYFALFYSIGWISFTKRDISV